MSLFKKELKKPEVFSYYENTPNSFLSDEQLAEKEFFNEAKRFVKKSYFSVDVYGIFSFYGKTFLCRPSDKLKKGVILYEPIDKIKFEIIEVYRRQHKYKVSSRIGVEPLLLDICKVKVIP